MKVVYNLMAYSKDLCLSLETKKNPEEIKILWNKFKDAGHNMSKFRVFRTTIRQDGTWASQETLQYSIPENS